MCGGVGFKIKNIPDEELEKYYSAERIRALRKQGRLESFYWDRQPVLPIRTKNGTGLRLWGNKDEKIRLPRTGWTRSESLAAGKWDYLDPEPVDIPVDSGYEKRTWFGLPEGTKGIIVRRGNEERVYILTQEADSEYRRETGHDREPPGLKANYKHEPGQQRVLFER